MTLRVLTNELGLTSMELRDEGGLGTVRAEEARARQEDETSRCSFYTFIEQLGDRTGAANVRNMNGASQPTKYTLLHNAT